MSKSVQLQCAESLQRSRGDGNSSGSTSVICAALAMIVQCAHFVEEHVRKDPSLGILSLAILAKTSTGNSSEPKLFTLWGPRMPLPREQRTTSYSGETGDHSSRSDTERNQEHVDSNRQSNEAADPVATDPDGNETNDTVSNTTGPRDAGSVANTPFKIDDVVAARCLSLLMDACGVTSHPRLCKYESLASIPAAALIAVVRSVMGAYKQKNEFSSKFVKYSSLLPKELRDRQAIYSSMALTRNKDGYSLLDAAQVVTLTVRKPDRNRKEVHFAMLASLLQVDPNGVCCTELNELALKGLGEHGCHLKPGKSCGGLIDCSENGVESVCDFYDNTKSLVGSGEVYPRVSFLRGQPIGSRKILMRFSSLKERVSNEYQEGFETWDVANVSRVNLLDAFTNTLGSAIIAVNTIQMEERNRSQCDNLDFSDAIILCDIVIAEEHKSEPYVFSEWGRFAHYEETCTVDFSGTSKRICRTLGELENQGIGFWHRKFLDKRY